MAEVFPKTPAQRATYPFGGRDLLVGTWRNTLRLYENQGPNAGFVLADLTQEPLDVFHGADWTGSPIYKVAGGAVPAAADVDGDGDEDIVIGYGSGSFSGGWVAPSSNIGRLAYFENLNRTDQTGKPVFAYFAPENASNPFANVSGDQSVSPSFVDLDGDGVVDLVAGTYSGQIKYYRGTRLDATQRTSVVRYTRVADDALTNPLAGIPDRGMQDTHASFVDLDGDGDVDMLVSGTFPTPLYYENIGTATVPAFTLRSGRENPFSNAVLAGLSKMRPTQAHPLAFARGVGDRPRPFFVDSDGDGDYDVVVGSARPGYYCSGCTYHAESDWPTCCLTSGAGEKFPPLWFLENMLMAEVPGTPTPWEHRVLGHPDDDGSVSTLTTGSSKAGATMREERRFARFRPASQQPPGSLSSVSGLEAYMSSRDGGDGGSTISAVQHRVSAVTFGDLDGDGDLDAIVVTGGSPNGSPYDDRDATSDNGNVLRLLRNTAGVGNTPAFEGSGYYGDSEDPSNCNATISCLGRLPFLATFGAAAEDMKHLRPVLRDWDGDGDLDIIVGFENDGTAGTPVLAYLKNNGMPMGQKPGATTGLQFTHISGAANPLSSVFAYNSGSPRKFIATPTLYDMDGDGDDDILLGVRDEPYLMYFERDDSDSLSRRDAMFSRRAEVALVDTVTHLHWHLPYQGCEGFAPTVIDWDGDGDGDIVATCAKTKKVYVMLNTGTVSQPKFAGGCPSQVNPATNCTATGGSEDESRYFDLVLGGGGGRGGGLVSGVDEPVWSDRALHGAVATVADVDGDGDDDLWFASGHGGGAYLDGNGIGAGVLVQLVRDACSPSFACSGRGVCGNVNSPSNNNIGNQQQQHSHPKCNCAHGWGGNNHCNACAAGYVQTPRALYETLGSSESLSSSPSSPLSSSLSLFSSHTIACSACPRGSFSDAAENIMATRTGSDPIATGRCTKCPRGMFQERPGGFASCRACPAGFAQNQSGSTHCEKCGRGFFQAHENRSICTACAAGQFTDRPAQNECENCTVGKSTLQVVSDPRFRPDGENAIGFHSCVTCAPGSYQDASGKARCKRCPGTQGQPQTGATSCITCVPGETGGSDGLCVPCPAGKRGSAGGICMACENGTYSAEGAVACMPATKGQLWERVTEKPKPCQFGTFGAEPGICTECPKGFMQDSPGQTECDACPVDTYNDATGRHKACVPCSLNTTTNGETNATMREKCVCQGGKQEQSAETGMITNAGFYRKILTSRATESTTNASATTDTDGVVCSTCPVGADCAGAGNRADTISALAMYWRADLTEVHFMDCSTAFSFIPGQPTSRDRARAKGRCCSPELDPPCSAQKPLASLNEQCAPGYEGMMCAVCSPGYVRFLRDTCLECPKGSSQPAYYICMAIFSTIVFIAALAVMMKGLSKRDEELHIGLENQAEGSKKALERQARAFRNTFSSRFIGMLIILMSWLQILSALAAAYPIPWPIGFTMYAAAIGRPANFDIAGVFAGVFCELRVPVLDEYLVQVITPAVAGFMVIMAWFIARMCGGGFSLDAKNAKKSEKKNNIYNVGKKKNEEDAAAEEKEKRSADIANIRASFINNTMKRYLVLIVQMLYPKLATMTFLVFRCREIAHVHAGGEATVTVLDADFSVTCHEGQHAMMTVIAAAAAALYLAGIPMFLFFMLWKNRRKLYEDPFIYASYGDLFRMYDMEWYFWELLIIVMKGLVTGMMAAIAPGTPLQLLLGTLLAGGYMLSVLKAAPYKGISEDWLGFITSFALTITLLFGFAISTDNALSPNFDGDAVNLALILFNTLPFGYLLLTVFNLKKYGPNHGTEVHHAVERAVNSGAMAREESSRNVVARQGSRLSRRNSTGRGGSHRGSQGAAVALRPNRIRLSTALVETAVHSHVSRTTQAEYERFRRQAMDKILARRDAARSRVKQRLEERRLGLNTHTRRVVVTRKRGGRKGPGDDDDVKSWKIVPTIDILSADELEVDRVRTVLSQMFDTRERIQAAFDEIDADHSGLISKKEFKSLVKMACREEDEPPSRKALRMMWKDAHSGKKFGAHGEIDADALTKWLTEYDIEKAVMAESDDSHHSSTDSDVVGTDDEVEDDLDILDAAFDKAIMHKNDDFKDMRAFHI
jgi:hypothetical protein